MLIFRRAWRSASPFAAEMSCPLMGHAAACGFFQSIQQTNKSTFTRAAVTDNAVYLPLLYRQIDVINGSECNLPVVKNLRNIAEYNHSYV